jgi:hypothetical protein
MKPTNTIPGQNSERLMLKKVVHTETTVHKELVHQWMYFRSTFWKTVQTKITNYCNLYPEISVIADKTVLFLREQVGFSDHRWASIDIFKPEPVLAATALDYAMRYVSAGSLAAPLAWTLTFVWNSGEVPLKLKTSYSTYTAMKRYHVQVCLNSISVFVENWKR